MLKDIGQTQPSKEALRKIICSVQDTKKSMPHISIGNICAIKNIPKATYYRYKKQFQSGGIQNLEPQSRAPKNRITSILSPQEKAKIIEVRKEIPGLSKVKIHTILLKYGMNISSSTIGRFLKVAKEKGLLPRV